MDEVVWPEKGPNATSSYTVHCTRLQVNQQGPGDIFTTCKHIGNGHPELKYVLALCQSLRTVIFKNNNNYAHERKLQLQLIVDIH